MDVEHIGHLIGSQQGGQLDQIVFLGAGNVLIVDLHTGVGLFELVDHGSKDLLFGQRAPACEGNYGVAFVVYAFAAQGLTLTAGSHCQHHNQSQHQRYDSFCHFHYAFLL